MTKTRDRTSEVLVVSCDTYSVSLFYGGKTPGIDKDTLIVEAPSLLGEDRVHVEVLANKGDNLYKFRSLDSSRRIRMVLCLLERHDSDVHDALTK